MSKFSLRKLVALGAATALGVTGFVGIAPANAATVTNDVVSFTYPGTGTKIVEGTDFNVDTASRGGAYLWWSETANGMAYTNAKVYKYTYQEWDADAGSDGDWIGSVEIEYSTVLLLAVTPNTNTPDSDRLIKTVDTTTSNATTIKWFASAGTLSAEGSDVVTLTPNAVTADTDITLTAYISNDSDNTRESDEPLGGSVVVTVADYVEANWVTTVQKYQQTEATADVEATLTPAGSGWNMAQMDDDIWMQFSKNGGTTGSTTNGDVTDTEPGSSLFDLGESSNGVYTARAYRDPAAPLNVTTSPLGAASAAVTVEYLYSDARVDDIVIDGQVGANITTNDVVRSGVKDITVPVTIVDVNGNPVAVAGQKVEVYATPSVDMTINGAAVKAGVPYGPVFLTTNASGKLSFPISNPTAKDGEYVDVNVYTYGEPNNSNDPGDGYASGNTRYEWEDAYVYGFQEAHQVGAGVISVTKGQSYTLNWTVHDQFGELSKDDLRVNVSIDGGTNIPVAVNNGKASYTVTEAYNAPDTYEVVGTLYKRDAAPSNSYTDWGFDSFLTVHVVQNTTVGALNANVRDEDGNLSVSSGFEVDVNYSDFGTHNFFLSRNTFFEGIYTGDDDTVDIEGVVTNSSGIVLPGAKVELKGTGQFYTNENGYYPFDLDNGIYSQNSFTVFADENGFYEVTFASQKSGANTVTVTSGGKSKSVTFTVDTPNEGNADSFAISAPKSVKAGRTITATVSVVDSLGNVVSAEGNLDYDQFTVLSAFSNRGLIVVGDSIGDDEGLATYQVKVMLQPLDRGPVVINLDWYEDNGARVTDSFAVWSGPAVNATAGAKKGRVIVEAYRSVGQTVNVFVGSTKVASFVPDAANDKFVVKGIKSGNRKVSVKVTPGYDFAGVIAVK